MEGTSSKEIAEWKAYDNLEPLGERVLCGMIAQLTAEVMNFKKSFMKKNRTPVSAKDLMPKYFEEEKEDWVGMKEKLMAFTTRGRTDKK